MDRGGFSAALTQPVLKFNGKLFKGSASDGYSLLLTPAQVDLLIRAAQANWREVEPAIFGTLLERALNPTERHALGAHYTPRAYVERLVLPTVITPLRADWADVQAAALVLAHEAAALEANPVEVKTKADFASADRHAGAVRAKWREARQLIKEFHHRLCTLRVLDPACGSGNFLYVTLEHLKRLEGEVLNQLSDLGETQDALGFGGETVNLQQLRGIELNERAAALAELVLWIGYLQWHIRTQGNTAVAEPVVHDYGNIECRDAVLAWDAQQPAYGADGALLSRWDGVSFKSHPVTGGQVPDESALVPQWHYVNPRQATWPQADYIVGNPPFIGAKYMREALGDGYAQALRGAWPAVPESADFVMYWWAHAASLVAYGQTHRMGLITTNSILQTFNRRVVQLALSGAEACAVGLVFAIPDHPWVDSANGAAVRIAMTVLARAGQGVLNDAAEEGAEPSVAALRSELTGALLTVITEKTGEFGEVDVTLSEQAGVIHADLSVGANVSSAVALRANSGVSSPGVKLHGAGFIVTLAEACALGLGAVPGLAQVIREYRNGRDLTDTPRGVKVIDTYGLSADQLRNQYPAVYQWLLDRVKPERDQNNRATYRDNWWLFGEPRKDLRPALLGLPRFITTVVTAKHRVFQFMDADTLADDALMCIACQESFLLGVLSSSLHVEWSLATGSTLEDRPRYIKSRCFETFPFPHQDTGLTPQLRQTIATLAEQIDHHRKQVLGQPTLAGTPPSASAAKPTKPPTLTALYNVLEALKEGRALTAKEKIIHTQGLVSILKELHAELDAAVLQAYQLQPGATPADILTRLLALNAQRVAEEARGTIHWLRPEFQDIQNLLLKPAVPVIEQRLLDIDLPQEKSYQISSEKIAPKTSAIVPQAWPVTLPEQVRAVAQVLAQSPVALSLAALEAHFKGRGPWKKGLPMLLQTLEALGRAQQFDPGSTDGPHWRA
jgi:hypothetical protein